MHCRSRPRAKMAIKSEQKTLSIFMAEDNEADVFFFQYALKEIGWEHELQVAEDGDRAIQQLSRRGGPSLDLIILDLNLPKRDGIEVLEFIRKHPRFWQLPVAIASSSPQELIARQLREARLSVEYVMTKEVGLDGALAMVRGMRAWWESREDSRAG